MRLLITTQAVDIDDPVLGFFHSWIEALSRHLESVRVVCLREGAHTLPANVSVRSLGKESGGGRLLYVVRFFGYAWGHRREYDAVFVHMNSEYVVLAGIFWRLMGKRVVLWRNHKKGGLFARVAVRLSHVVCYTSPDSFVARYGKSVRMPVGIDTTVFTPSSVPPSPDTILFLGRLDEVKRVDVFVRALRVLSEEGVNFIAHMYGSPTDPRSRYAASVRELATPLVEKGLLHLYTSVPHRETPALYQSHAIYANLTPSGSFDKTIGEAMACGCLVVSANRAVQNMLPEGCFVRGEAETDVSRTLRAALAMSGSDRQTAARKMVEYVAREHSLAFLVERLSALFIQRT